MYAHNMQNYDNDCSACKAFKPILNQTNKKINRRDYQNKDNRKILQSHNLYSTPDILVIRKGKSSKALRNCQRIKRDNSDPGEKYSE